MGNKPYTVETDENGKRTRISVSGKNLPDGIDFKRGSCYHDSRPKRRRTRGAQIRFLLESHHEE